MTVIVFPPRPFRRLPLPDGADAHPAWSVLLLGSAFACWAAALFMAALIACAVSSDARAAEYEIYAERSGKAMRADEPNSRRFRDRNAEPFVSLEDCRQAAKSEALDHELGSGWSLQCRPLHVPAPRVVVR